MIVHIAIGNSDDKLTQREWAKFWGFVDMDVRKYACNVLGAWMSAPSSQWQNAAWCIEIEIPRHIAGLRKSLSELARLFRQDSIAWTPGETEFIEPRPDDHHPTGSTPMGDLKEPSRD